MWSKRFTYNVELYFLLNIENILACRLLQLLFVLTQYNWTIKALTALVGRLSLSVGWHNGPERGL